MAAAKPYPRGANRIGGRRAVCMYNKVGGGGGGTKDARSGTCVEGRQSCGYTRSWFCGRTLRGARLGAAEGEACEVSRTVLLQGRSAVTGRWDMYS